MRIIVTKDYESMSKRAANMVAAALKEKPNLVLGLATGGTPIGMYQVLIELYKAGQVDFCQMTTFNLDEYCGLSPEHPQSYHYYMNHNLFSHINMKPKRINIPDGTSGNMEDECLRYEDAMQQAGGIDLQILGIGVNGHIGFNEPGAPFGGKTGVVELTESTIEANARFFESSEEVPRRAISMGIKSIMRARRIILLASGNNKAEAVFHAALGPVTPDLPASALQLHPDATMILDKEAAALFMEKYGDLEVTFSL